MTQAFWKPAPREPWRDWRMYSMLLPIVGASFGALIFMALGFSFTEMAVVPDTVRVRMVVVAAFSVSLGSTFGSIGSGIEIFRKRYKREAEPWDWVSLGVSTLTTIAGFAMGFAALLGAKESWSIVAQAYGSLVVGTLAGLDSLGDMIELGGLFGSYEMRMERWLVERREWEADNGPIVDPSWPTARVEDWREITAGMNGDKPRTVQGVVDLLHKRGYLEPSPQTMGRWLGKGE